MGADPTRRFFSPSETTAAWLRQDRRCRMCRSQIARQFVEGDHIIAFDGQNTTMDNLQALCSACNRRKGNRSMQELIEIGWASPNQWGAPKLQPGDDNLRSWQVEALEVALRDGEMKLIEACPGAGKTRMALEFAYRLLDTQEITRLLLIVPTVRVVRQWVEQANDPTSASPTLPLAPPDWRPHNPLYEDWVGAATTYATLFTNTTMLAALAAEPGHRTLVVFDEVHHAGIESAWGRASQEAFRHEAERVLSLSGTPFRTKDPIVFVKVDSTGAAKPDYVYNYGQAISEEVCRPIQFVMLGGSTIFESPDGETHEVAFDDELSATGESYRLRTALDADGNFLPELLKRADDGVVSGLQMAMQAALPSRWIVPTRSKLPSILRQSLVCGLLLRVQPQKIPMILKLFR